MSIVEVAYCNECSTWDDDPITWCDCRHDEPPCKAPCRQRAHAARNCPKKPTHAGAIAAKLQGAHARRQRGEDTDMSEKQADRDALVVVGANVWDDDPFVHAMKLAERMTVVLADIAASGHAPDENAGRVAELERQLADERSMRDDERVAELERQLAEQGAHFDATLTELRNENARLQALCDKSALAAANRALQAEAGQPQASAVSAERVVELERKIREWQARAQELDDKFMDALVRAEKAEVERDERERWLQDASNRLSAAYVAREIPWTDVAAGMMTLSREEHPRPWMVKNWTMSNSTVVLVNGKESFEKVPHSGETVRVLVPYVTPEQAEATLRAAGAVEVSS